MTVHDTHELPHSQSLRKSQPCYEVFLRENLFHTDSRNIENDIKIARGVCGGWGCMGVVVCEYVCGWGYTKICIGPNSFIIEVSYSAPGPIYMRPWP